MNASRGSGDDALIDALSQSAFQTVAALSRLATEHDMSLTQLRVLAILRDRRVRMAQLADYLGLERSSLSGLIDRAQARGLVERVPDALDGRALQVGLTDAGRDLAQRLAASARAALTSQVAPLVAAERDALCTLLTKSLSE